ncbi:MAG: TetR/AcrR family transcriptional regulator [Chloroflexi bacterium]|nr:TetR/AcrR family transcriptional regulator [Chloroflexota bacterium]
MQLFTEQGAEVRLEDIAQRAGVSRQSVYVHFGSRTGLLLGMVQYVDEREHVDEQVQRVFQSPSALQALDAAVSVPAGFCPVVYPLAKLFMAGRYEDEAIRAAWDDRMQALHRLFRALVEWLDRDGVLSPEGDVDTATDVLWAWVSWQVWEQLVIDQGWSKERYEQYLRMVLRRTFVKQPAS